MTSSIYATAELYEKAFSYRDVRAEVHFLLDVYRQGAGCKLPSSALEIACGPAAHAIELRRHVPEVHVLDNEPAMLALAARRAEDARRTIHCHLADMRSFHLGSPVDLAFCMLDSLGHLHTRESMIRHLAAVAHSTTSRAIYVVEMGLPRAATGTAATLDRWQVADAEGEIAVRWEAEHDTICGESGTTRYRVEIRQEGAGCPRVLRDVLALREWTLEDMRDCLGEVPPWGLREVFGSFAGVDLLHEDAWRMILVLTKEC